MEPRPLPKRKSFSVEPPANAEQSSQSLALAMLGEGKQLQTDGMVKVATSISTPSETGDCLQTLDVDEQVLALSFDCLGKYFQIAGEDGIIRVFDVATGTQAGPD
ncbi:hypothetical protein FJT64_014454 [Amphibalanus amphitrite]|uniref:Uncharacterized protein n=1 Tax=Amphibalanus amphitrite TaxID=1232801 RepID=A0A6A4UWN3_AMPAM|nr:hypothetical protein FJT64_014454 [Amphibalanus amphitrite]